MNTFSFASHKNKHSPSIMEVQYLALASEPKDVTLAGRGSFGYHSRYLAKRRLIRTMRRLRRV